MFDHIWDCDINHPIFDDTVGELMNAVIQCYNNLPSAEPHWIAISERLPEEKKDVLIAFKHNMAVGFWEDIWENGEPAWYAKSGDGWMTGTTAVDSDGIPIAWMPLPEPYREGEQECLT